MTGIFSIKHCVQFLPQTGWPSFISMLPSRHTDAQVPQPMQSGVVWNFFVLIMVMYIIGLMTLDMADLPSASFGSVDTVLDHLSNLCNLGLRYRYNLFVLLIRFRSAGGGIALRHND